MQSGGYKMADDGPMAHFLKTPIGAANTATEDAESTALDLPCQLVVFRIECQFIKSADLVESLPIQEHEHSGCKRPVETGEALHQVASGI
jgi:hypothetical protein